jgi:outer membrane protein OmpA-like peptidoglycan-associated protein
VRTDDATNVVVVVKDFTKVRRVSHGRDSKVTSANLVPGLRVHADGEFDTQGRFIAEKVRYEKSSMKLANTIQGGVMPTELRAQENSRLIAQQQAILAKQAELLALNGQAIKMNEEKITATNLGLTRTDAAIKNMGYKPISSVTVYFKNGQYQIEPKYRAQLQQLAAQAKSVPGYMIQVQGFASAIGSAQLNNQLSARRAGAVTAELQQNGVAPTHIAVPAAMGTSVQVASNKTAAGQAENRRTVVTLLQNTAIAAEQQ